MSQLLDTAVGDLRSCGILSLLEELETLTSVSSAAMPRATLWQFLTQCVYPRGLPSKREKIDARSLPDSALLNTTLRLLSREGSAVYDLCEEIARRNHTSLEFCLGQRLFTFLNRSLPRFS